MLRFSWLSLSGGVGLFLYGITLMSEGLESLAGRRAARLLRRLAGGRWRAMALGAAVTAVIQSSTATTVTAVGLVSGGLLSLEQAAAVILGANIGTTITGWLGALGDLPGGGLLLFVRPAALGPLLVLTGALGLLLCPAAAPLLRPYTGLGLLFLGLCTMEGAMAPLADSPALARLLEGLSSPAAALLAGAAVTALLQSSSASVGLLQALAASGAVRCGTAVCIIMGQNIGTCLTVLLAGLGGGEEARRASLVHLWFNLLGTLAFLLVFSLPGVQGAPLWQEPVSRSGISLFHTLFNLVNALWMMPCLPLLLRLSERTVCGMGRCERG